jgi:hypothetical protein
MTEDTETSESSPMTNGRLRIVYVTGIALNVIALTIAAMADERLAALTLGIVIVYLSVRYWMIVTS